jgi:ABC-type antimicrobial peptide transport system permease subunit
MTRVAVFGLDVRNRLFPDDDPLAKTIRVADVPFQVIGLLKSRGAGPAGASLDNVILIPINTASRRLFNRDSLTMLIAQVRNPEHGDEATARVTALLRARHHIQPPALDDFTTTNPAVTAAHVARAGSTLTKILTGVSVMALLIRIVIMSLSWKRSSSGRRDGRHCNRPGWRAVGYSPAEAAADSYLAAIRTGLRPLHCDRSRIGAPGRRPGWT